MGIVFRNKVSVRCVAIGAVLGSDVHVSVFFRVGAAGVGGGSEWIFFGLVHGASYASVVLRVELRILLGSKRLRFGLTPA